MNPFESQSTNASTLLISSEGIILDAHDAVCTALEWSREALINKTVGDLFEYGADLVLIRMQEIQSGASSESEFSVSALVRKQDQTNFPTTAIVRRIAELDCFSLGFDDLPVQPGAAAAVEVNETPAVDVQQPEPVAFASEPAVEYVENIEPPVESVDVAPPMQIEASEAVEIPVREIQPAPQVHHSNGNGNGNGNGGNTTTFRNIFLSSAQRPQPKADGNGANGKDDVAAQLEGERQERKRLEARVLSLTEQLKQLHAQLQSNLESENIFQKRVCECEEAVREADQSKAEAEAALEEKEKARERVEHELAEFTTAQEQFEEQRKSAQQEWLGALETSLAALKESDARLAKEMETRRGIQATLQALKEDLRVQAGRVLEVPREAPSKPTPKLNSQVEAAGAVAGASAK